MQRTTLDQTTANLAQYVRQLARNDEQYFIHAAADDIAPAINAIPQEPNREAVAVLISPKRYAWLIEQSKIAANR